VVTAARGQCLQGSFVEAFILGQRKTCIKADSLMKNNCIVIVISV
jgi:hypothetical protein